MQTASDPDPWCRLPQSIHPNIQLDPKRFAAREKLVQETNLEDKLGRAIYFGRLPGLSSQMCDMRLHEKLKLALKTADLTTPHW